MKKIIGLLSLTALFLACDGKNSKHLTLKGNIKGLQAGKLVIYQAKDTSLVAIDSVVFDSKSNFKTKFKLDEPQVLYLYLDKGITKSIDNALTIFAEPGEMELQSTLDQFYNDAKITGSKNQSLLEQYNKTLTHLSNLSVELIKSELKYMKLEDVKKLDSIKKEQSILEKKRAVATLNFVLSNKEYEIAPFLTLRDIPNINIKYLDSIHNVLPQKIQNSKYGLLLQEHLKELKSL